MTRIHGLDLARALAILGMMAAHLGPRYAMTTGYPSVLFAVLAGVSMGIISRGLASGEGGLPAIRFRLILRGVILVGLGAVLSVLQTGIYEVLTAIGVSYVLLTPVVTWSIRRLSLLLGGLVVFGPLLVAADGVLLIGWRDESVADLLTGVYPLLAWLAYLLAGLLLHRLVFAPDPDRDNLTRQVWLAGVGLALLVGTRLIIAATDFPVGPGDLPDGIGFYLQGEPHTGGVLDLIGSAGAALLLIGLCLLACRAWTVVWASYPLRAMGSMSLTVYVTHVLGTAVYRGNFLSVGSMYDGQPRPYASLLKGDAGWGRYPEGGMSVPGSPGIGYFDGPTFQDPGAGDPNWWWIFGIQALGLLIFAALWRWRFRRGPLEAGMHRMIEGMVRPTPPAPTASGPRD